jgi:o-succinylbenzoate synthase
LFNSFAMLKITFRPYTLFFKFDAGTSRGVLKEKKTWFVRVQNENGVIGIGECGPLKGLSPDDIEDFEFHLKSYCRILEQIEMPVSSENIFSLVANIVSPAFPSIRFGFETALLDLLNEGKRTIFSNSFVEGKEIPINGLVWMGSKDFMLEQIDKKLEEGYNCIKIKIGAIEFSKECEVLLYIRSRFDENVLSIRVDANGAFSYEEAQEKLRILSDYRIHSIEQPIKPKQLIEMAELVKMNYVAIALDEELIGVNDRTEKIKLLETINPPFIILKPTLHGGLGSCKEWIELAEERSIHWWITSALESNIGLNAIAQFAAEYPIKMPQGLGTGQLYTNNIDSPLEIESGYLHYNKDKTFNLEAITAK